MWKRIFLFFTVAFFLLLTGWFLYPTLLGDSATPTPAETAVSIPPSEVPVETLPTNTQTIPPTQTPVPSPAPPTAVPQRDLAITAADVQLFPAPQIYAGERVTFQISPRVPDFLQAEDVVVDILVDGQSVGRHTLNRRNFSGQALGRLEWAWQTAVTPGTHEITVILDPDDVIAAGDENLANNAATLSVTVQSPYLMTPAEASATWVTAETNCCVVHAISGTAAYRDLPEILDAVETAVQQASSRLNERPNHKLHVYFADKVFGQGGFSGINMAVSYLDRKYVGGQLHEVLVHETVHILDQQFAPQRIKFFAEGLAVWATEGHYKHENIDERAAALLTLNQMMPLESLIDNFYPVQHEIAYLQAAGFVTYLVDTFGWETFRDFYSATTREDGDTEATAVDSNLQLYYGRSLAEMEAEWLAHLETLSPSDETLNDLDITIRFYNLMRRYQLLYDPSAHFLTAWLPAPDKIEQYGNPADFTRHPETEMNVTLELMLETAVTELQAGNHGRANLIMDSITRVFDNNGSFIDPLANSYLGIVQTLTSVGYEPQQVDIQGETATAQVTTLQNNNLQQIRLGLRPRGWVILP